MTSDTELPQQPDTLQQQSSPIKKNKSHKGKGFFIILLTIYIILHVMVVIVFVWMLLPIIAIKSNKAINNPSVIGPGLFLVSIGMYMLLPLGVIDAILVLLYPVRRFLKGEAKQVGYAIWFAISLIILSFTYPYFINAFLLLIDGRWF